MTFKPNFDTLAEPLRSLWPSLAPAADDGFVLYGGTGLSLRLGHRVSIDFDFFNDRPLNKPAMRRAMPFIAKSLTLQDEENSLTVLADAGGELVKVSFFGNLHFGRVANPDVTADGVTQVASLLDLCATKMKAIFDRIEAKDYRDILAIVAGGLPIESGLAAGRAIYGNEFQASELLKALTYFEGGDLHQLTLAERRRLIDIVASVERIPELTTISKQLAL